MVLWNGFAIKLFWNMHVVSLFKFEVITIIQAIVLSIMISYLSMGSGKDNSDKSEEEQFINTLGTGIIKPLVLIIFAYALRCFI